MQCHVRSWGVLLCFTLRQDSRFPRLGGRLYATINFEMGIRCPEWFRRFVSLSALGGAAMMSLQRDWMCGEGGFEGWKGKWMSSAFVSVMTFLSFQLVVFSYATFSLALVSAVARSGRIVVEE